MGVTRNVENRQREFFTPTFKCHVSCKGRLQKREKEAQHAKKTGIPKSSGKVKILKGGNGES